MNTRTHTTTRHHNVAKPPRSASARRVFVLIDGSNFYHSLKYYKIKNTTYFNYRGFIQSIIDEKETIVEIKYYIGAVKVEKASPKSLILRNNQIKLFNWLSSKSQNIKIEKGFLLKNENKYHEKGVDIKIATDLIVGAYEDLYDNALLLSSDTDLIPAIQTVIHKGKTAGYIGIKEQPSYAMIRNCTYSKLIEAKDLSTFSK